MALDLSRMISLADRAALAAQGHAYRPDDHNSACTTQHSTHKQVVTPGQEKKNGETLRQGVGLHFRSGEFSFGSGGGDDDLCNDKDLNNSRGQVKRAGSHGSVNIEGNFL